MQIKRSEGVVRKPYVHHKIVIGGDGFGVAVGHGFSKCHPNDRWDANVGRELAELRARVDAQGKYIDTLIKELRRARNGKRFVSQSANVAPINGLGWIEGSEIRSGNGKDGLTIRECVNARNNA
jgi:hypothetical protein